MKVLFFGTTDGTACALHYFTSLVRLGHAVLPFDPGYYQTSGPVERLRVRLRHGPTAEKTERVAERLLAICRENAFDLVFVMAENYLDARAMDAVRKGCRHVPRFLFHSHDNVFAPGIMKPEDFDRTLASYDFVFTTKSQNVKRLQDLGQRNAIFVPSAYEPAVHRPIPPDESAFAGDFDVTFVGTYDHSRIPWLEAAGWERLNVWGGNWQRFPRYAELQARIVNRPVYYFEFADVISRSRCTLGLLREEAGDLHTQRTFEIPACGGLQIAPRNEEVLSFFKENHEIVCFESPAELTEKIDRTLRDTSWARGIARRGHERVLTDGHTYQDRVALMMERVGRQQRSRPPVTKIACGI